MLKRLGKSKQMSEARVPHLVLVPVPSSSQRVRRWYRAPLFMKTVFLFVLASIILSTGGLGAAVSRLAVAQETVASDCTTLVRATSVCVPQILSGGVKRPAADAVTEETVQYMWGKQAVAFNNSLNWLDRTYPETRNLLLVLNESLFKRVEQSSNSVAAVEPTSWRGEEARGSGAGSSPRMVSPTVIPIIPFVIGGALINWGVGKLTGTTVVDRITSNVGGAVGNIVADQFDFLCFWSKPPNTEVPPKLQAWPGLTQTLSGYDTGGSGLAGTRPTGSLALTGLSGLIENPYRLRTEDRLYTPGFNAPQSTAAQSTIPGVGRATGFEWWGSAGQTWESSNYKDIDGICAIGTITRQTQGTISNTVWLVSSTIAHVGLLIFYYASIPDALEPFLRAGGPLDTVLQGSVQSLFLPFAIPMIFLVSFWVAWQGLFKRRSTEVLQGVLWTVLAGGISIVFLSSPTTIVNYGNNVINTVQGVIINVFGSAGTVLNTSQGGAKQLCELGGEAAGSSGYTIAELEQIIGRFKIDGTPKTDSEFNAEVAAFQAQNASPASRWEGIRTSQCTLWSIFIFSPWARGQFGELAGEPVPALRDDLKVKIAGADVVGGDSFALVWLDSRTLNHDEALRARGVFPNAPLTADEIKRKMEQQVAIYNALVAYTQLSNTNAALPGTPGTSTSRGGPPPSSTTGAPEKLGLEQQAIVTEAISMWSGDNGLGGRLSAALLSYVSVFAAGIPIIVLSFLLLMYQLITVVLLFLAPIFLLFGIHPGFGRKIALGWVEQILNISLKRIGATLLIGILIMLIGIVMATAIPIILQIILMGAFSIATLVFSKRILSMIARVDLNGNQIQDIEQAINDSSRKVASATAGAATAAATAGAGGASSGGMMKAAGSGGVGGFTSGSMMGGVTSGTGAGMSVAANERQERAEAEENERQATTVAEKQQMIQLLDEMRTEGAGRDELADLRSIFQEFGLEEATKEAQRIRGMLRESDANAERRHEEGAKKETGKGQGGGSAATLAMALQSFGDGSGNIEYTGEENSVPVYNGVEIKALDLAGNPGAYPDEIHENEAQSNSLYRDTYIYGLAAMDQGYTDVFSQGIEGGADAEQKRSAQMQQVMDASDESNAVQWEQYARNSRKAIPMPQNAKLKEILEEAGVKFLQPEKTANR